MEEERLIELVRGKEFLYNKSHRDYKKNEQREKAWEEISQELGIKSDMIKANWKTIRDRFMRLKHQVNKPSGSGAGGKLQNYKFYDMLSFLNDCSHVNKSTHCSYDQSTASTESITHLTSNISNCDECEDIIIEETIELDDNSSDLDRSSVGASSSQNCGRRRAKRSLAEDTLIKNTNEELLKLMKSIKTDFETTNTKEAAFCDSLRVQLEEAKLPPDKFMEFQVGVLHLLKQNMQ